MLEGLTLRKIVIILLLILIAQNVFAEDIVVPEGILEDLDIDLAQAQQFIQELSEISNQIEEIKTYVDERTNLLANFMVGEMQQSFAFLIIIILISNLASVFLIFSIVLWLKSKGRW